MNASIASLEPKQVWSEFANILQIPRPSGHEEQIAEYLISFANKHNYAVAQDESGNVIIKVDASLGRENSPRVILQAHMDMVPVALDNLEHDFLQDPIDAYIEDGFVKAHGTTLGADDGIGIATILAILDDKELSHGPLTAIFTVEEETTMKGALGVNSEDLQGDYLINLDSEDNGLLYIGCAGSCDVNLSFKTEKIKVEDCVGIKLTLNDFLGGHSGADIHLGRANAISILALVLNELSEDFDFFISSFTGGIIRNAIPSKAMVYLNLPKDKLLEFKAECNKAFSKAISTYERIEKNAKLSVEETEVKECLSYAQSLELVSLLLALPHGIERFSDIDPSIVETSANLGTVKTTEQSIDICMMPRSLKENGLDEIISKIEACAQLLDNVEISYEHRHACWLSADHNALIDCMQNACEDLNLKQMKITLMHAGLETATFAKTAPNLQLVSLGATILNPHSPQERVNIQGVGEVYQIVKNTLAKL
ncbi:MAG: beta-Ala-His dipeptidase [Succinatimonas sp.]|nr:beta-Ala-His dipeptidase [Succinatimonas sp.]